MIPISVSFSHLSACATFKEELEWSCLYRSKFP